MKKISLLLSVLFVSFMIGCKSIDELDVKPKDGLVKFTKPFVLDTNSVHLKPNSMESLKQLELMLKKSVKNDKSAKKADFDGYGLGKLFWQAGFSPEQNQWFNSIELFGYDSEDIKQKLWDDVYNVRNFLDMLGMERNPDISSPYFSLSLALLSAAHTQSIGGNLTSGWVGESYQYRYNSQTLSQIVFNDFIGRSVATNSNNQNN